MVVELSRELLIAAKRGDRRAYERVGMWLADTLITVYRSRGRSVPDARELSQKTAEDLLEKFDQAPENPDEFRDFVIGFAMKTAQQHRTADKRHERKRAAARVHPWTPARRPDSLLALRRLLRFTWTELSKLPSPYRHTLNLVLERDNYGEVADELNIPEKTVQRRMWRIRRVLESALRRSHITSTSFRT